MLKFDDVVGSLLGEEIRWKFVEGNMHDATLNVDRGRKYSRGTSQEIGKSHNRSKSRNIESHNCGKKGHIRHDCYAWKRE